MPRTYPGRLCATETCGNNALRQSLQLQWVSRLGSQQQQGLDGRQHSLRRRVTGGSSNAVNQRLRCELHAAAAGCGFRLPSQDACNQRSRL